MSAGRKREVAATALNQHCCQKLVLQMIPCRLHLPVHGRLNSSVYWLQGAPEQRLSLKNSDLTQIKLPLTPQGILHDEGLQDGVSALLCVLPVAAF